MQEKKEILTENNKGFVLLLGASIMQLPALRAIESLGYLSLVVDADKHAPLMCIAHKYAAIDLKNIDALTEFLDYFVKEHVLSGVFTVGTDFSYVVSFLSHRYNVPSHTKQSALHATDKVKMRTILYNHGVNVPAFVEIPVDVYESQLFTLMEQAGLANPIDVVVKPVDSMGARGVIRVQSLKDIVRAVHFARSYSRSSRVIIEDYLDGPELSIDALVSEGEVFIHGIADRHIYYPPYFIEMGHTIPSLFSKEVQEKAIEEFIKAIHALGLTHGAAKGDIKVTKNGIFIGEVAGRLSGGYMSGWTYPLSSGVDLTQLALRLAVGDSIKEIEKSLIIDDKFCAERAFISIPGVVADLLFVEKARSMQGVREFFIRINIGDSVTFPKNNVEKAGNVLVVADTYDEASALAESARKEVFIRLQAENSITRDFLFGSTGQYLPSAFIAGKDFNGNTRQEILMRYQLITGHNWADYYDDRALEFERSIEKGGLQGAVWYYDTYGTFFL